jgi:hypothetical protein
MFSQFSPAFISTMRSTLDIDPPLLRALGFSAQLRPRVSKAASSDFELACATRRGQDIFIDFRWAERNYARLAEFAAELIRLRVDVLVTYGTPGTLAATATLPIIMLVSGDAERPNRRPAMSIASSGARSRPTFRCRPRPSTSYAAAHLRHIVEAA